MTMGAAIPGKNGRRQRGKYKFVQALAYLFSLMFDYLQVSS